MFCGVIMLRECFYLLWVVVVCIILKWIRSIFFVVLSLKIRFLGELVGFLGYGIIIYLWN